MTDEPAAANGSERLRVLSLFSGIGGLDRGLELAGHSVVAMCESWEPARRVLHDKFPGIPVAPDVATFEPEVPYDVLAAGFPCTDVSHAGRKAGIFGPATGLVKHVFRIARTGRPEWIVLENVPHLLTLDRGAGINYVTRHLERLGYRWAYRTVDSRFTGVPQRRPRVIILASLTRHPASVLLKESHPVPEIDSPAGYGFYWTEGRNGLGFVPGAVPTLKGGSTIGLPSAPAVWLPKNPMGRRLVIPSIGDGEVLQGLPRGWTKSAVIDGERDLRWKLVGNAVTVGVGTWIGSVLNQTDSAVQVGSIETEAIKRDARWPTAGWGDGDGAYRSTATAFPAAPKISSIDRILREGEATPLSHRATAGFLARLDESQRQVDLDFYADLERHLAYTRPPVIAQAATTTAKQSGTRARASDAERRAAIDLRRSLSRQGFRYRLQVRPLDSSRVRVAMAFPSERVAVDVRHCAWHGCPEHEAQSVALGARWAPKVARAVQADADKVKVLSNAGWRVVVVWSHDSTATATARIAAVVIGQRQNRNQVSIAGSA